MKRLFCSYLWVHIRAYICESTDSWKTNETSPMEMDLFIPTHHGTLSGRLSIALTTSSSQQRELPPKNICGGKIQSS